MASDNSVRSQYQNYNWLDFAANLIKEEQFENVEKWQLCCLGFDVLIESTNTTSMEDVSTGVLKK